MQSHEHVQQAKNSFHNNQKLAELGVIFPAKDPLVFLSKKARKKERRQERKKVEKARNKEKKKARKKERKKERRQERKKKIPSNWSQIVQKGHKYKKLFPTEPFVECRNILQFIKK